MSKVTKGTASRKFEDRLDLFDQATQRQRQREMLRGTLPPAKDRGWKREDLYADRALLKVIALEEPSRCGREGEEREVAPAFS